MKKQTRTEEIIQAKDERKERGEMIIIKTNLDLVVCHDFRKVHLFRVHFNSVPVE